MVDQALFAGTNFLVGVLLARWLEPAAYGAFSTAYAVFLLVGTLYNALWTEPMMVYGAGRFRGRYAAYLRVLLVYHWRLGALVFIIFVLVGFGFWALGQAELSRSFLGLTVAAPLVLYLWLIRREAYMLLEPQLAVYGGVLYLLFYLGAAGGLVRLGQLNEITALIIMGGAAWSAGILALRRIWNRVADNGSAASSPSPEEVRALHWSYGRWALASAVFAWVPGNFFFMILPTLEKLQVVGALRAFLLLFQPSIQINSAISSLLIPIFSASRLQKEDRGIVFSVAGLLMLITGMYAFLLVVWGEKIAGAIYGAYYAHHTEFLLPLALLSTCTAPIGVFSAFLRAREKPRVIAEGYLWTSVIVVSMGTIVALVYKATGAAWIMTVSYVFLAVFLAWRLKNGA